MRLTTTNAALPTRTLDEHERLKRAALIHTLREVADLFESDETLPTPVWATIYCDLTRAGFPELVELRMRHVASRMRDPQQTTEGEIHREVQLRDALPGGVDLVVSCSVGALGVQTRVIESEVPDLIHP